MKRLVNVLLLFVFVSILGMTAYAVDEKSLKSGKTYAIDLNGGNKEKVKISFQQNAKKNKATWKLYVNKRKEYSYTFKESEPYIEAFYLDLDCSDKYHEIFVLSRGVNCSVMDARIIRYYKKGKTKTIKLSHGPIFGEKWYRRLYFKNSDGNNHISFYVDSPFSNFYFGMCHCLVNANVNDSGIYEISSEIYDLQTSNYSYKYQLNSSMELYNDSFYRIQTLPRGTVFTPLSIKPTAPPTGWQSMYVKIVTQGGVTGWLFFPNYDPSKSHDGYSYYSKIQNKYLVTVPLWG